jgi:hypothetical protein
MTPRKPLTKSEAPTQPKDFIYWMGRVDGSLCEIHNLFQQYVTTNEQNWTDERGWRKVVNEALSVLDNRLSVLETRIASFTDPPNAKPKQGEKADPEPDIEKTAVTWKWLVEKLAVPIVTAVIIFLMLQFFPSIFVHLAGK